MSTTDRHGALHDKTGRYTEKTSTAPGAGASLQAPVSRTETGGLSPAQRRLLDRAEPLSGPDGHGILVSGHEYRTALSLEKKGLGELRYQGPSLGWFKSASHANAAGGPSHPAPEITGLTHARDAADSPEDVTLAQLTQYPHAEAGWFSREMGVEPGWSQKPEILGTLMPYMRKNVVESWNYNEYSNNGATGGLAYFGGIDGEDAQTLLDHLPEGALQITQNGSPTVGSILKAAADHPGEVTAHGYYVPSNRPDERVSVEGVYLARPDLSEGQALDRLRDLVEETGGAMDEGPTEFDLGSAPWDPQLLVWRAWWD